MDTHIEFKIRMSELTESLYFNQYFDNRYYLFYSEFQSINQTLKNRGKKFEENLFHSKSSKKKKSINQSNNDHQNELNENKKQNKQN